MFSLQSPLIILPQKTVAIAVINNIPGKVIFLSILAVYVPVGGMPFQRALGIVTVIQVGFEKGMYIPVSPRQIGLQVGFVRGAKTHFQMRQFTQSLSHPGKFFLQTLYLFHRVPLERRSRFWNQRTQADGHSANISSFTAFLDIRRLDPLDQPNELVNILLGLLRQSNNGIDF